MTLLVIFLGILACAQASPWDNLTANIAVVEFHPSISTGQRLALNTKKYIELIEEANNSTKLDMIIFPEATLDEDLRTAVELHMDNPCHSYTYPEFMKNLSCAALQYNTYLVINILSKTRCHEDHKSKNCEKFGFYFYNTDVVFDRRGAIISRYHKYNLFGEEALDKPKTAEKATFETDFGIKFGIFTCFDILFKSPAQDLLKKKPDGIIFPSMWYSELPFLTALQTQQMWAYAHNITFFGAGANEPRIGSGGSGIYRGSMGTVLEGIVAKSGFQIFIYKSKKGAVSPQPPQNIDVLAKELDNFEILTDPIIKEFSSTIILDSSSTDIQEEVCYDEGNIHLCCNFTLKIKTRTDLMNPSHFYTYRLVAHSGIRSFKGKHNGGIEICAIIACLDSSLSSCGKRFPKYEDIQWPLTFEEISIEANFPESENRTEFPNSVLASMRPIDASETSWLTEEIEENGEEFLRRRFILKKPQDRVLTFAIFGRDFGRDSPPSLQNGGGSSIVTWFLSGCVIVLVIGTL